MRLLYSLVYENLIIKTHISAPKRKHTIIFSLGKVNIDYLQHPPFLNKDIHDLLIRSTIQTFIIS